MSTRRRSLANLNMPGLEDPGEYNFEEEFLTLADAIKDTGLRYAEMDIGKVLGLARAYARRLQQSSRPILYQHPKVRGGPAAPGDTAPMVKG